MRKQSAGDALGNLRGDSRLGIGKRSRKVWISFVRVALVAGLSAGIVRCITVFGLSIRRGNVVLALGMLCFASIFVRRKTGFARVSRVSA